MTVKELIKELKKCDMDNPVKIIVHTSYPISEATRDSYKDQHDIQGIYDLENGIITVEADIWINEN